MRVPGEDEVAAMGKVIAGVWSSVVGLRLFLVPPVGWVVDKYYCRAASCAFSETELPRCLEDFEVRLADPQHALVVGPFAEPGGVQTDEMYSAALRLSHE